MRRKALTGDFVALSVADTGNGIPPDLLSRVVEPFFTTKGPDKGTGLGLSQVYGFARRSDGTVTIDSEVGRGTKVTVYLPRSHAAIDAPSPEDDARYVAMGRQTILVVEDNPDVRHVAVSLLEQLGYQTIEAETASAGSMSSRPERASRSSSATSCCPARPTAWRWRASSAIVTRTIPVVLTTGYTKVFDTNPEFPGAAQAVPDIGARPRHPAGAQSVDAGVIGAGELIGRVWPSFAEASEGILLRDLCGGKSCEAPSAKQDGGRSRDRTYDPLIKSQLLYQLSYAP